MAEVGAPSLGYRSIWGGIAAAFVGLVALFGYLLELPVPLVIEVLPGPHAAMSLAETLALIAGGTAAIARATSPRWRKFGNACMVLVGVIAATSLIFHAPGIDPVLAARTLPMHAGAAGNAPIAMSPDVALFLLFACFTFALTSAPVAPQRRSWVQILLAAQLLMALWALIGQLGGGLENSGNLSMAQLTAIGVAALTWAGYEARDGMARADTLVNQPDEARLQLASVLGIVTLSSLALLISFDLVQWRAQRQTEADFLQRVNERAQMIASEFDAFVDRGKLVASRPRTLELLADSGHAGTPDWRESLNTIARSYLPGGFSAVALVDAQKRVVAGAGTFRGSTALSIAYPAANSARLLWDRGIYLQLDEPIYTNGVLIGDAITQQPLERLTRLLRSGDQWGETGELELCSGGAGGVVCFPTRFRGTPFALEPTAGSADDVVVQALEGGYGVRETRDYRGRMVLAAYRKLGPTDLALMAKMDLDEVARPFAQAFSLGVLALVVMILVAHLYSRIAVRSRADALSQARDLAQTREMHFRAIVERSLDAILTVRTERDSSGDVSDFAFTFANASAERLLDRRSDEIVGRSLCEILPWARASGWYERCRKAVDTEQSADADVRADLAHARGAWLQLHAVPLEEGLAITIRGIDDRKAAQARLRLLAPIDEVTELPNRALFVDRLERSIIRTRRRRGLLALLDIDIDHFSIINDRSGHAAGDSLLREFAERVSRCLRAEDTVARLGGDEFAVIIEGLHDRREAQRAAEAILSAVRREIALPTGSVEITASIGIAFFDGDTPSAQQLLDEALAARLQVQSRGGNAYFHAELVAAPDTLRPVSSREA